GDLITYDHNSSIAHVQIVDPYDLELLFFFLPLYNSLQSSTGAHSCRLTNPVATCSTGANAKHANILQYLRTKFKS
ncbi:hypothetical protein BpHYR1_037819, partial [Brachionus plicatilis]